MSDLHEPEVVWKRIHEATKCYLCCECHGVIKRGEIYLCQDIQLGKLKEFRMCYDCSMDLGYKDLIDLYLKIKEKRSSSEDEDCECFNWAKIDMLDGSHHPNCPSYKKEDDLLARLIRSIEVTSVDTDGIHYDLWPVYREAKRRLGQEIDPKLEYGKGGDV